MKSSSPDSDTHAKKPSVNLSSLYPTAKTPTQLLQKERDREALRAVVRRPKHIKLTIVSALAGLFFLLAVLLRSMEALWWGAQIMGVAISFIGAIVVAIYAKILYDYLGRIFAIYQAPLGLFCILCLVYTLTLLATPLKNLLPHLPNGLGALFLTAVFTLLVTVTVSLLLNTKSMR